MAPWSRDKIISRALWTFMQVNINQVSDDGGDCGIVSREALGLLKVGGIQILYE